jgi:hypothetical protein
MLNRKLLDALYSQKFQDEAKLIRLKGEDTFACCTACNESPSYQRHIAEVQFLEERIKYIGLLIGIVLSET